MSYIGEPIREWQVEESPVIPEREVEETEREEIVRESETEREREVEKV